MTATLSAPLCAPEKLEMVLADPCKPETLEMLTQAYHDIYLPSFPNIHERESLQTIMDLLCLPVNQFRYVIVIAGTHLQNPGKRKIHGMCAGGNFFPEQAGLIAYMAVLPEYQNQGLGRKMVGTLIQALKALAASKQKTLACVIIEIHDPEKVRHENDIMAPKTRLGIYKKWGAKKIPINYVLPPLEKGQEKCRDLLLMAYPVDGKYPDKKAVLAYIQGVYGICDTLNPENDPDLLAMEDELSRWDGSFDVGS